MNNPSCSNERKLVLYDDLCYFTNVMIVVCAVWQNFEVAFVT